MALDPRTPVVIGVAQHTQRPDNPADAVEALALMELVVTEAAQDSDALALLPKLDYIGVIQGAWRYSDPARLIADNLGSTHARTGLSANGGNSPQAYVNSICSRIAAGQMDAAAIVGAETIWSRRRQRRAGLTVAATDQPPTEPDERFGDDVAMINEFEQSRGIEAPIHFYPLFESAIRASRGESLDEHRDRVANLWARFNEVAINNPHSWARLPMSVDEIRNPSPSNRMVGFPYTKAMNSNWDLDQAAAVVICSVAMAEQIGISKDRWIFPWVGTEACDTPVVSNRRDLHSSPSIQLAGQRLFDLAGLTPDDLDHVDLYSCFPSAVQVAAAELGLDESRQLTQTGGLTFAGGPLNNYVTHSIAAMTNRLRADDKAVGLVTANGGFLTKHALGIYSTEPPPTLFKSENVQDEVDKIPATELDSAYNGPVTIEAYTVMHNSEGPEVGLCALKTPTGARTWGSVTSQDDLAEMLSVEAIGKTGNLAPTGELSLT